MANDYSMTMSVNLAQRLLTWKQLRAVQYAFDQPFQLELEDGDVLYVEQVVRLVPKKRMVVFGIWQEKSVVAKLFFDTQHAKRHINEEAAGVKILQQNKIPTPALHYTGKSKDKRIQVMLFERIYHAKTLAEVFANKTSIEDIMPQLESVVVEMATQHVLGVMQQDLHLDNFLLTEKIIYTLDGGQVEYHPNLLSKKTSVENLALFLAQLGVGLEKYQEKLFLHYAKSRGWLIKLDDTKKLFLLIHHWNTKRWQQYQRKIFRDCSDFASTHNWKIYSMHDRNYAGPEFMRFMQQPELAFNQISTRILKAGRSSTVVKVTLDNKQFVIKRYNLKSVWHRMRRLLRPTRAIKSWRFAQKLRLFHVATPRPVACIEQRWLGLRGKAYYIMEHVPGLQANQWFKQNESQEDKVHTLVTSIVVLLRNLAKLEITHGDLKLTNLIIDKDNQPLLLDFDGAAEHASLSSLRSGWRKDIKRLLQNFQDQPTLLQKFKLKLRDR